MTAPRIADCPSCRLPVLWVGTATSSRPMAIDRQPHPQGTVRIYPDSQGSWLAQVMERGSYHTLRKAHYQTCIGLERPEECQKAQSTHVSDEDEERQMQLEGVNDDA
jgi:hypothetical protein